MALPEIPLFPLSTVLFPDGQLQLRIFESRYLDMVRECARKDAPFGVCLILEGEEVGAPALPASVGTLARMVDFDALPRGLLGIRVCGGQRFRVVTSRVRDDGLVRATVREWPTEPCLAVPPEFSLLATIVERMVEQMGEVSVPRARYDDASWIGFRLAELLPLELGERQHLLELTDPMSRLATLRDALPRFQRD
ncbi:MAG TPA: LON peptidase substrate-binding domain-containing protein [Rhodanobacteraceae bacterium]|nr:LON peptidase substrate-binding domain-containing protein [Rhodanobacteraceae bacterium]